MNGEPMPKAIKDLFNQDSELDPKQIHTTRFAREFNNDPTFIVYHGHESNPWSERSILESQFEFDNNNMFCILEFEFEFDNNNMFSCI